MKKIYKTPTVIFENIDIDDNILQPSNIIVDVHNAANDNTEFNGGGLSGQNKGESSEDIEWADSKGFFSDFEFEL